MEVKKSPRADLEGKRLTFLLIGFVLILSALYVGFEWSEKDIKMADLSGVQDIVIEDELIPITRQENIPPPPPPPPPAVVEIINVVEDNKKTEDVKIVSTEDNQKQHQEIVFRPKVVVEEEVDDKIFTVVEEQPAFPGGEAAMYKFIGDKMKYPVIAQENGIQGRVICSFVVNRDGKIVDIEVVRGVDPSLDAEAKRVIAMMPPWKPAKQLGKTVRAKFNLPILFRLQ